jgi:hypothetical protein
MEVNLQEVIEKKFLTTTKFTNDIEDLVKKTKLNYIDAIVQYCEENNVDLLSVPKLISKPLKEKIKCNAIELNYIKRTSKAKLPI